MNQSDWSNWSKMPGLSKSPLPNDMIDFRSKDQTFQKSYESLREPFEIPEAGPALTLLRAAVKGAGMTKK
jgi:hypothetical protein